MLNIEEVKELMPNSSNDNYDDDEPYPRRRRPRSDNPFDDIFNYFMNQFGGSFNFENIFVYMYYFLEDLFRRISLNSPFNQGRDFPGFVWGFRMTTGPDGRPHIERFGNTPKKVGDSTFKPSNEREPLVDVIEDNEVLRVIAEIPGVRKQDIDLSATDSSLLIQAESEDGRRKYYKELDLPCLILPDSASAKFKNGVLEVELKKKQCEEKSGKKVKVT